MKVESLLKLLDNTRRIVVHQKEKEKLRGEKFNIFSVLRMERNENFTHSAFLCELLNPGGTHQKSAVFLRLFLKTVLPVNTMFDEQSAAARTEAHLGIRDDACKTGGRVDIYIEDKHKQSICIENKLYAADQYTQVERYCNHNKKKNTVLYLSLWGSEPSAESKGKLESGRDFHTISYHTHILDWLTLCWKESADTPILRETIRQYILLIKKLTGTMDNLEEQDLHNAMFLYFEESGYIAANFERVKQQFTDRIRQEVIQRLEDKYKEGDFLVESGDPTKYTYSQIWIMLKGMPESYKHLHFGVESFSGRGHCNGKLFVGVYNGSNHPYPLDPSSISQCWPKIHLLEDFEGLKCNLGDSNTITKLYRDAGLQSRFIDHIVKEVCLFIGEEYESLKKFGYHQTAGLPGGE